MKTFNEFRWGVATTLARWSKYPAYGHSKALLASLLVAFYGWGTYQYAFSAGTKVGAAAGLTAYHEMCLNYGGYVVDQTTGSVVECKGLGQISEDEMKKEFKRT